MTTDRVAAPIMSHCVPGRKNKPTRISSHIQQVTIVNNIIVFYCSKNNCPVIIDVRGNNPVGVQCLLDRLDNINQYLIIILESLNNISITLFFK